MSECDLVMANPQRGRPAQFTIPAVAFVQLSCFLSVAGRCVHASLEGLSLTVFLQSRMATLKDKRIDAMPGVSPMPRASVPSSRRKHKRVCLPEAGHIGAAPEKVLKSGRRLLIGGLRKTKTKHVFMIFCLASFEVFLFSSLQSA